jgi:hypothetical protein
MTSLYDIRETLSITSPQFCRFGLSAEVHFHVEAEVDLPEKRAAPRGRTIDSESRCASILRHPHLCFPLVSPWGAFKTFSLGDVSSAMGNC